MSGDGADPTDGPSVLSQVDTGKKDILFWVEQLLKIFQ